jgi:hypothetical protein
MCVSDMTRASLLKRSVGILVLAACSAHLKLSRRIIMDRTLGSTNSIRTKLLGLLHLNQCFTERRIKRFVEKQVMFSRMFLKMGENALRITNV